MMFQVGIYDYEDDVTTTIFNHGARMPSPSKLKPRHAVYVCSVRPRTGPLVSGKQPKA